MLHHLFALIYGITTSARKLSPLSLNYFKKTLSSFNTSTTLDQASIFLLQHSSFILFSDEKNSLIYSITMPLFVSSCPAGWIATEEGGCTDDNECTSEPCNNGGTCINLDNGQGFLCVCQPGYAGDICHLPVQEKMILVASGTYWVIAFVLINVVGKPKHSTIIT